MSKEETFVHKLLYERVVATPKDLVSFLRNEHQQYDFDDYVTRIAGLIDTETYVESIDLVIRAYTEVTLSRRWRHDDSDELIVELLQWKPR